MESILEVDAATSALTDILYFCRDYMTKELLFDEDQLDEIFNDNSARQLEIVIKLLTNLNGTETR